MDCLKRQGADVTLLALFAWAEKPLGMGSGVPGWSQDACPVQGELQGSEIWVGRARGLLVMLEAP